MVGDQPGCPFVAARHSLRPGSAGLEAGQTASETAAGKHKHNSPKARRNLFARRRLWRRENGFSHVRCYSQAAHSTSTTLCLPPRVGVAQQSAECTRCSSIPASTPRQCHSPHGPRLVDHRLRRRRANKRPWAVRPGRSVGLWALAGSHPSRAQPWLPCFGRKFLPFDGFLLPLAHEWRSARAPALHAVNIDACAMRT